MLVNKWQANNIGILSLLLNKRELSFSIGKGNKEFDLSTENKRLYTEHTEHNRIC